MKLYSIIFTLIYGLFASNSAVASGKKLGGTASRAEALARLEAKNKPTGPATRSTSTATTIATSTPRFATAGPSRPATSRTATASATGTTVLSAESISMVDSTFAYTAEFLYPLVQQGATCGYHTIKNATILLAHAQPRDARNALTRNMTLNSNGTPGITLQALRELNEQNRRDFLQAAQVVGKGRGVDRDIAHIRNEYTGAHELEFLARTLGIPDDAYSVFHPTTIPTHTAAQRQHAARVLREPGAQHLFLVNHAETHWLLIVAHRSPTKLNLFVIDSAPTKMEHNQPVMKSMADYQAHINAIIAYLKAC